MKQAVFYFLLPLILCCCVEPTFFAPEIVSAEYVSEDSCKLGYRGNFSEIDRYDFFKNMIASNSDGSNNYRCKDFKWIDYFFNWSWTKTYYVLWYADIKWDKGKTIEFHGFDYDQKAGFNVPN